MGISIAPVCRLVAPWADAADRYDRGDIRLAQTGVPALAVDLSAEDNVRLVPEELVIE
jgi:hypothetical protein